MAASTGTSVSPSEGWVEVTHLPPSQADAGDGKPAKANAITAANRDIEVISGRMCTPPWDSRSQSEDRAEPRGQSGPACPIAADSLVSNELDSPFRPCNLVELMPRLQEV